MNSIQDLSQFEQVLDKGAFGTVFKYSWRKSGRESKVPDKVAVKILDDSVPKLVTMASLEVMKSIEHGNVLKLYGWRYAGKLPCMVMELCNENLDTYRNRWKTNINDVEKLMFFCIQMAAGLEYMHSKDLTHMDLKPENVLVAFSPGTDPGEMYRAVTLKLSDFRLKFSFGSMNLKTTNTSYAAPEIAYLAKYPSINESKFDPKAADVFSMGILFHFLVVGKVPFSTKDLDPSKFDVASVLSVTIQSDVIRPLIKKMLMWEPKLRCSMNEVIADLAGEEGALQHNDQTMIKLRANSAPRHILIVLAGPLGSGRTSTMLHMTGQKEIEAMSNRSPETRETVELNMHIEKRNPELQHITLGFVSTPGLVDSRGKDQDARNMACIDTFLNTHKSLQPENGSIRKYPDVVLFVIRGDLERDIGKKSQFSKSLKQLLCGDLHLVNGSNLIIVLTHALGMENNLSKWAETCRCKIKMIQDFLLKVRGWDSVPVVLLENDRPKSMIRANEWTTMFPDGTKQPLNLLDCIADKIFAPKGDLIGKEVIREFFHGDNWGKSKFSADFKTKASKSGKKNIRNGAEEIFYSFLKVFSFDFPETSDEEWSSSSNDDIKKQLSTSDILTKRGNVTSDFSVKPSISSTLLCSNLIREIAEIAMMTSDVKKCINPALTLQGFNIHDRNFTNGMVFQKRIVCNHLIVTPENRCICVDAKDTAAKLIVRSVTVHIEIGRIEATNGFRKLWQDKSIFTKDFIRDLQMLEKFKYNSRVLSRKLHKEFFRVYGQALVLSCQLGGSAVISFTSSGAHLREDRRPGSGPPKQLIQVLYQFGLKKIPDIQMHYADETDMQVADFGNIVNIKFSGGNTKMQTVETISQWMESLKPAPVYLLQTAKLMHFHEFVQFLSWLRHRDELGQSLRNAFEDMYTVEGGLVSSLHRWVPEPLEKPMDSKPTLFKKGPKHAQIVLVGPSGGGKTSTIIHLIGHTPDVRDKLKISKYSSETRATTEYVLKLSATSKSNPADGSTMSIIDTPGLDDTDGPRQDARNLASIRKFLDESNNQSEHPNLVLFVSRGDLTRDIGPFSQFTRCLNQLCCTDLNITDGTNLIIVLTFACQMVSDPSKLADEMKEKVRVIGSHVEKIAGFKDVPIVFLDNNPPNTLRTIRDFTVLPDGTEQPKNLFLEIAKQMADKKDFVGKGAIRDFFARDNKDSKVHFINPRSVPANRATTPLTETERSFLRHLADRYLLSMEAYLPLALPIEEVMTSRRQLLEEEEKKTKPIVLLRVKAANSGRTAGKLQNSSANAMLKAYDSKGRCCKQIAIFSSNKELACEFCLDFEVTSPTPRHSDTFKLQFCLARVEAKCTTFARDKFSNAFIEDLSNFTQTYDLTLRDSYMKFFQKYGQGLVKSARAGGEVTISFLKPDISNAQFSITMSVPRQLAELLSSFGIPSLPAELDVSMYYANNGNNHDLVREAGNRVQIDFKGGDVAFHDATKFTEWKHSLSEKPEIMVTEEDLLYYYELPELLPWLEQREVIAENLRLAHQDIFGDGRKEVAEKDERRDIDLRRLEVGWNILGERPSASLANSNRILRNV